MTESKLTRRAKVLATNEAEIVQLEKMEKTTKARMKGSRK